MGSSPDPSSHPSGMRSPSESADLGSVPFRYSCRFVSPSPSGSAPASVGSRGRSWYWNSHPSGMPSPSESAFSGSVPRAPSTESRRPSLSSSGSLKSGSPSRSLSRVLPRNVSVWLVAMSTVRLFWPNSRPPPATRTRVPFCAQLPARTRSVTTARGVVPFPSVVRTATSRSLSNTRTVAPATLTFRS